MHDHRDSRRQRQAELARADDTIDRSSQLSNTIGVQRRLLPPTQPPNVLRDYQVFPMVKLAPQRARCTPQGDPIAQWWTITANASQVTRSLEGPGAAPLLDWSEIAARQGGVRSTDIQLELDWDADTAFVDIGAGIQISILAPTITANLWVPSQVAARNANTAQVRTGIPLVAGTNQVLETLVSVGMSTGEAPIGSREATCTRRYLQGDTDIPVLSNGKSVSAGLASVFQIPPRSQYVTFYVGPGQTAPVAGAGITFLRSAFGDTPIGMVDAWDRRASPRVRVPQAASVFRMDGFDVGDQVAAVWELDL